MMTMSMTDTLNPAAWSEWQTDMSAMAWTNSGGDETSSAQWPPVYGGNIWGGYADYEQPVKVEAEWRGKKPVELEPWRASPLRVALPEPLASDGPDMPELVLPSLPPGLGGAWPRNSDEAAEIELIGFEEPQVVWKPLGSLKGAAAAAKHVEIDKQSTAVAVALPQKPTVYASVGGLVADIAPQGIVIRALEVGTRIEWQIDGFCSKFQSSPSRPIVSPPFSACGLPNLRLMVLPANRESAKASAKKGLSKKGAAKKGPSGPVFGALKLKADCLQGATIMTLTLSVGPSRAGPFTYDFSQQAVHGPNDFGIDWFEQVDHGSQSLTVSIEISDVIQS